MSKELNNSSKNETQSPQWRHRESMVWTSQYFQGQPLSLRVDGWKPDLVFVSGDRVFQTGCYAENSPLKKLVFDVKIIEVIHSNFHFFPPKERVINKIKEILQIRHLNCHLNQYGLTTAYLNRHLNSIPLYQPVEKEVSLRYFISNGKEIYELIEKDLTNNVTSTNTGKSMGDLGRFK